MSVPLRHPSSGHQKRDNVSLRGGIPRAERGASRAGTVNDQHRRSDLVSLGVRAEQLHAYRARRSRFLPSSLLGEPGWDLLLYLFAATTRRETVGTTKACAASGAPMATALRWIARLSEAGLIETMTSSDDHRLRNLRLTGKGIDAVAELLDDNRAAWATTGPIEKGSA